MMFNHTVSLWVGVVSISVFSLLRREDVLLAQVTPEGQLRIYLK
ncbi:MULTISPECIES: hypothetical protein [Paenibacillus]|nr:hypothetical protein [Paenibacillus caseinilyticus]MCZ8521080.1 hypothetical protein [Paenibacillus caseinilyticus]